MKINQKQFAEIFKIKDEYSDYDKRYNMCNKYKHVVYFYQDEEHGDSAINMHIHWAYGVEIVSVDAYGDIVRKSWL